MKPACSSTRFRACMFPWRRAARWILLSATSVLVFAHPRLAAKDPDFASLEEPFGQARALVHRYCAECHSPERAEAEIDLTAFDTFSKVQEQPETWQKVGEMLEDGQMPPEDAPKPTDEEQRFLHSWVWRFLKEEAKRNAGDPGPVVLRRLSNAEYAYSLRDLTGVSSLDPAREFPVDGAAGEGFTNAGQALVMSPSLLTKYLDAGKEVAAHAVLLPSGIRFSPHVTRRDWTEEILAEIRELYGKYTEAKGSSVVNLQGIVFDTNGGGRLPVEQYLSALLAHRKELDNHATTLGDIGHETGLSPKYLTGLWQLLNAPIANSEPNTSSVLLDRLREEWKSAKLDDVGRMSALVADWQQALWRFTSVGHIGKAGAPQAWMEPVSPIVDRHEIRVKVPVPEGAKEVTLYLVAADAGDGNEHDFAVWERPRLVAPGRPDLLIRDVRPVTRALEKRRDLVVGGAAKCLAAAAEVNASGEAVDIIALARKHEVDPDSLAAWLEYLGIGTGSPARIHSLLTRQTTSLAGYDFVQGWIGDDALSVVANSSDQAVRIPGNMAPHGIAVHPSPTLQIVAGWRSPVSAALRIEGFVQHAHPECGNGVTWALELRRGHTRQKLAAGIAHGDRRIGIGPLENIAVHPGDLVSIVIGPRDGNHSCDLTAIDLILEAGDKKWSLAADVSPNILAGNPHADRLGNSDVWHFLGEPATGGSDPLIPAGSLLARWQSAATDEERRQRAEDVQRLLSADEKSLPKDSPDTALYRQLTSFGGPLFASALRSIATGEDEEETSNAERLGLDPALFGKHPRGNPIESASFAVQAPAVTEIRLPADLLTDAEFVTAGTLHADTGNEGTVQFQVTTEPPATAAGLRKTDAVETTASGPWTSNNRRLSHSTPIVAKAGSHARRRIEDAFDDFREWFPAALCYTKIVPVDEVVTLTLYYREDDHLRRLMLDDQQSAHLDRLWEEMHFVSQDAFAIVDAYEQLLQFATQDADPKVFEPLREPIYQRAEQFRARLSNAEPKHVEAVLAFAGDAFRRPLRDKEAEDLRVLYQRLRREELGHEDAVRLLLARVLVSPAFLYRPESTAVASENPNRNVDHLPRHAQPVSDFELATRLGYFLWSSVPDAELRNAAANGDLHGREVLLGQARRMLKDERVRRLATEFVCQWLHVYEFDAHDEKSETTFPTFSSLRGAMYEETIRFATDLFQRDGSVLEFLDADHTFVNEDLARHYELPGVTGPEWRRLDGLKAHGRGGVLGMATTLAKQSGASRTSPILRGNWVSEVLLGEKLPKPPKGVPQLPDEVPAGLTERQLIEKHSSTASCAKCHARIDPLGFTLEGFDAIGRTRTTGAGGEARDLSGKLLDGGEIVGLDGLRQYLLNTRRDAFVRQFCKKLLGYALGRGVLLSDEPLLDEMQARLKANGYRARVAIETILISPQFLMIRGHEPEQAAIRRDGVSEVVSVYPGFRSK